MSVIVTIEFSIVNIRLLSRLHVNDGVTDIRPGGQNQPCDDFSPAH